MKQAVTRVDDKEYDLFQKTATSLGTTPSDVLRMFIYAFNDHHGFPYAVQSQRMQVEPFESEEEATEFATRMAMETMS